MHEFIRTAFGAGLMAFVGLALAHPSLLNSVPKSDEALDTPPKEIRLKCNDPIEVTFTHVKVVGASGRKFPMETTQRDPSDTSAAIVPLPLLGNTGLLFPDSAGPNFSTL